ncbi:MAG TPA: hypothetical protein VFX12_03430 [Vicinamibacterales bacterium]|nr:hypothetical protein [Vicinamibacterales bacterium]
MIRHPRASVRVRVMLPALGAVLAVALAGCSPQVDLKQTLQVTDVAAGWHDAGVVAGKNKIVPSVTFRLKKPAGASVSPLALNAVFKRLNGQPPHVTEDDWDEVFVQNVPFEGDQTAPLTVTSPTGYTADPPQSRADMLANSQFRDMRLHLFAKSGSGQWVEVAHIDIPRTLLAQ